MGVANVINPMVFGGGFDIGIGGYAFRPSNGTSDVLERPKGYSVGYQHFMVRSEYYGDNNGSCSSTLQGSDDKSTWNNIASGGTANDVFHGAGDGGTTNNKYKYYRLVISKSGNAVRGVCCMYLLKDTVKKSGGGNQ